MGSMLRNDLAAVFSSLSVEQLKSLLQRLVNAPSLSMNKSALVEKMVGLYCQEVLEPLYRKLSTTEQRWLSDAVHSVSGDVTFERFSARYGDVPRGPNGRGLSAELAPFVFTLKGRSHEHVPAVIQSVLKAFIPPPPDYQLAPWDGDLPPEFEVAERELAAQHEFKQMLAVIQAGKLKVSDKTLLPSAAQLKALSAELPEYYPNELDPHADGMSHILASGWIAFFAHCDQVQHSAGKLKLATAGFWQLPAPDIICELWQAWLSGSDFDEFSRIDAIKGQRKAGVMTPVVERRQVVQEALSQCPVGQWVGIDDFSRFMLATDRVFDISHDVFELYIADKYYGHLGCDYPHWSLLQERYLRCLLMEYAATLGLVDIAFTTPIGALEDYTVTWGGQELNCLSRYDGLVAFRLTPLGAYAFGLAKDYVNQVASKATALAVKANHLLEFGSAPLPEEVLLLSDVATPLSDTRWQLDEAKLIKWVESGRDVDEIGQFILSRDTQPRLPQQTQSLLQRCDRQGAAGLVTGMMHSIVISDPQIAQQLSDHPKLPVWVAVTRDNRFMVPEHLLGKFHKWMNSQGYGLVMLI